MPTLLETFDMSQLLQPMQAPADARQDAAAFGPSLTILRGQVLGVKTSDKLCYPLDYSSGTNEVQTLNFTNSPAGTFRLSIVDSSGFVQTTQRITYSATIATLLSNLQTATDAVLAANAIVWSGTLVTAVAGTFSGAGYAGIAQPLIVFEADGMTAGDVDITRTTAGGETDGTQNGVGLALMAFKTDANGKVFVADTTTPSQRVGPWSTAPIWKSGIFNMADLYTSSTVTAQVDTFTPANVEVGDIFTITFTGNALQTEVYSFTATATTAANVVSGLLALLNASNSDLASKVTATGTATLILTAKSAGTPFTAAATTTDGGGSNTQTFTRVATTANAGRSTARLLSAFPGSRILHNGFIKIP